MIDSDSIKSGLRQAHPQVFQALEQAREGSTSLRSNVPPCIAAVRILKHFTISERHPWHRPACLLLWHSLARMDCIIALPEHECNLWAAKGGSQNDFMLDGTIRIAIVQDSRVRLSSYAAPH